MPEERKTRRELLEERLMILTLQTQPKLLFAGNRSKLIRGRLNQRLIAEVEKYLNKNKEFDTSGFSEKLPKELFDGYSKIVLSDIEEEIVRDSEKLEKEIKLVEREIKVLDIKEEITSLTEKINEYEKLKESEKLQKVKEEFSLLTRKLNELEESEDKGIIL